MIPPRFTAYNSMIHWVIIKSLSINSFGKEIKIIKQMSLTNSYKTKGIDNFLNKEHYKSALNEVYKLHHEQETYKSHSLEIHLKGYLKQ